MTTPIFDHLATEHGFDPLEGIEYADIRAIGHREPIARERVSPSIHTLPRYRARYGPIWESWQVEKLHYMTEYIASYQVHRMFGTEADATEYADAMNRGE